VKGATMAEKRKASGTGLDSNVSGALSYVLGLFTGVLFLVVEKDDKFVRFHAVQSILFSVAVYIIYMVLVFIPIIGWILLPIWSLVSFIYWLILIFRAYNGKEYELPYLGKIAHDQVK
jgi:uncharacterized membrane protein